jgi:putative hydrolase of the HAD superfamily
MCVKAVFLDVDDTLVDYAPAARASFAAVFGPEAPYEQWLALDHYERYLNGELSFRVMRETRMADFLQMLGRAQDVPDAVEFERRRFEGLAEHYRLFDDALPCVAELRARGLRVGLITNNESEHQREKIRRTGLDGLFDAVIISDEVGVAKPNARIFEHALAALDVAAGEAMHVGDNLVADARGARDAGLIGVWLDRYRQADGALDVPVVHGLAELTALLGDGGDGLDRVGAVR